jgi:hypothetical protein
MQSNDRGLLRGLDRNHPLMRPLQEGENPAWKDAILLQHLNVTNFQQASHKLAGLLYPGYRIAPKRDNHGRLHTSVVLLKASDFPSAGIPDIVASLIMKWVLRSLRAKNRGDTHLNIKLRARQLLRAEMLGIESNPYYLKSARRDTLEQYAKALKEAARPKRFNDHHEKLVRGIEARYSYWRQFEPLLLEVLPFYLFELIVSSQGFELWDSLFQKCEQHYSFMRNSNQPIEQNCPLLQKANKTRTFYLIRPDGDITFVKVRDFLCQPTIFDGGSFIEEGDKTGVPYVITEIGPGTLLGKAPSMKPPWPKYEALQQEC